MITTRNARFPGTPSLRRMYAATGRTCSSLLLRMRAAGWRVGPIHGPAGQAAKWISCLASAAIAVAIVIHLFGPQEVVSAATGANLPVLLQALGVGLLIQVVRAQRVRLMLARQGSIPLFQSFGAMVVGHGIGDLLPLAPGGPVLRCVIIERLAGISIAFSSGVCIAEGMLDVIAPGILVPYVLLALALPGWARWVLIGVGAQTIVLLALFAALGSGLRIHSHRRLTSLVGSRLPHLLHQVTDGLRAVTASGPQRCATIVGWTLLQIVLTVGQVALFLHSFSLHTPFSGLLLLVVMMLSAGSLPIKIPALGTMTAAVVLPIAGVQGAGVGGYLLVSQFLLSSQTVILALLVLGWWFVRGVRPFIARQRRWSAYPGNTLARCTDQ